MSERSKYTISAKVGIVTYAAEFPAFHNVVEEFEEEDGFVKHFLAAVSAAGQIDHLELTRLEDL